MKEYKVINVQRKKAEALMNDMARQGWEVKCVTYWMNWDVHLIVTFEREIEVLDR